MIRIVLSLVVISTTVLVAALTAFAGPITVPSGLNPGDHYRLAFVTSTTRDATSLNIADYNTFVTNVANSVPQLASLATSWSVIGSTPTVDARDNTLTNPNVVADPSVPIYTLGNSEIAVSNSGLWSPSGSGLLAALNIDETGSLRSSTLVWTGSTFTGIGSAAAELGTASAREGTDGNTNVAWIQFLTDSSTLSKNFYAISGVLTVPEPSSFLLGAIATSGTVIFSLLRRRHSKR
jgi:hypothetical protein